MRDRNDDDGPEDPGEWVRCLACGETVEKGWLVEHVVDECDGEPLYEDLGATDLVSHPSSTSETVEAGGQATAASSPEDPAQEPAPASTTNVTTVRTGDHVFHQNVVGQANANFAHRADWAAHCRWCQAADA